MRVPINLAWSGLRDEELQKVSGVHDATFVHNTGFIGGAKSLQSVLRMAEISLTVHKKKTEGDESSPEK